MLSITMDTKQAKHRVRVIYIVDADQAKALREEALRRALEAKSLRPDASAVLREILARWMARRKT
jgi:hypothetical protein